MEKSNSTLNSTIEVNNIKLSYNDVGIGKIPVVFLHGFPFNKSMWDNQLKTFEETHRFISVDFRSFGQSTNDDSALSMDLLGDDLIGFLNALKLRRVIICGLSMGGFVALNAITRYPERFAALILCDTNCVADKPEQREKRYKTIEEIEQNGTSKFSATFLDSVFADDTYSSNKELVTKINADILANTPEVIINGLKALAMRNETCSKLKQITVPTLIICGREDEVTPLEQSEFMNKHIKDSTLKVINNAGHLSNMEQPKDFNAELLEFLSSEPIITMVNSIKEPNANLFV
ncbi:alpha/beta hydrolase [Flavobacterium azooxidireducens]|uniref:Alpha/beta hydrolase n=1 Tax=Flavobacterium azooxidireducens TaxID=1871076 RepID=A0ABY4KIU3_9FLAO|nr:alpha/beta hydrolase [Flavobacterium azooxidireducens]UPQ79598.1 alpha/beta hydrolase [Flavobacterium azooxidireducens]